MREAAKGAGFTVSSYGALDDVLLPVLELNQEEGAPWVYLSSGVHGNEPAGPMAVLDLLRRRSLPAGLNYTLFPMINPSGLLLATRENRDGLDLNRDYGFSPASYETRNQLAWIGERQFDLTLCLHEDDDGEGFYLYEHVPESCPHDYGQLALQAAKPWTGIDPRERIDDMPAQQGRMRPPASVMDINRNDLPEALRLHFHHGSRYTFTTETPSRHSITNRIRAQCAVVETILRTYASEFAS